jgi:hypothetical protein
MVNDNQTLHQKDYSKEGFSFIRVSVVGYHHGLYNCAFFESAQTLRRETYRETVLVRPRCQALQRALVSDMT